jgi:type I restriction-modification system DNA methylase subunit
MKKQEHLNFNDTVNFGSYYTPKEFVDLVYKLISKNVQNWEKYTIIDSSCGYGNFLKENSIGADIDLKALEVAKKDAKNCVFIFLEV